MQHWEEFFSSTEKKINLKLHWPKKKKKKKKGEKKRMFWNNLNIYTWNIDIVLTIRYLLNHFCLFPFSSYHSRCKLNNVFSTIVLLFCVCSLMIADSPPLMSATLLSFTSWFFFLLYISYHEHTNKFKAKRKAAGASLTVNEGIFSFWLRRKIPVGAVWLLYNKHT